MSNYKIENMAISYLDDVMEIEAACYGKHHWSRASFLSELDNRCAEYFCMLQNKRCIGYIGMWQIFDEAHITNLAVHPDFWRKKAASLLIINAIEYCYDKKIKFLTLEVRKSNERALLLYEKFGFKSLGLRKKYYQDNNEDAVIMWTEDIFSDNYKNIYNPIKADTIKKAAL